MELAHYVRFSRNTETDRVRRRFVMNPKPIIAILALFGILWLFIAAPAVRRKNITDNVARALDSKGYGDVQVSVADRHVYLWGSDMEMVERDAAERIAQGVRGVSGVSNFTGIQDDLIEALETSAELEAQLTETLAQLKDTEDNLEAMELRAEMTAAQLKDTQTMLADTRSLLTEREKQLAAFKAAWSNEKTKLEISLHERDDENEMLRKTLAESRVLLAEARRVLAERDSSYAKEASELKMTIGSVTKELGDAKAALTSAGAERDAMVKQSMELEKNLAAATAQAAQLEQHRKETEALLMEVRKVLSARDKEYALQSQQLAAAEKAIADLKVKLQNATKPAPEPTPAPAE